MGARFDAMRLVAAFKGRVIDAEKKAFQNTSTMRQTVENEAEYRYAIAIFYWVSRWANRKSTK